ncbi:hypothetical protein EZS27_010107 [termite gut metagenome]|uniref:Uncharacterized protein n=1 Tax=termite gut metagenome TaxID=433724 RepID=A0A5J4S8V8_9ZZZZ
MKKINFFLLFVFTLSLNVSAQHLTFKDIPIDGHIDNFIVKMQKIGFKTKERYKERVIMTGRFTEEKCDAVIWYTSKTKTVFGIELYLPRQIDGKTVMAQHEKYVDIYTEKYGKPKKKSLLGLSQRTQFKVTDGIIEVNIYPENLNLIIRYINIKNEYLQKDELNIIKEEKKIKEQNSYQRKKNDI